jgi:mRNA interferase MazF
MKYSKGDIVVIPVPFTDNQTTKKRPAVVVSNEDVHARGDIVVVQITSQNKNDMFSFPLLDTDLTIALPKQSYIRTYKLFVLEECLIEKKVSSLTMSAYKRLYKSIRKIIA